MRHVPAVLIAVCSLALPTVASAGTIARSGDELRFEGVAAPEDNPIAQISPDGKRIDVYNYSGSDIAAGAGCDQIPSPEGNSKQSEVECALNGVKQIRFTLGDGDDGLSFDDAAAARPPLTIAGGEGEDFLSFGVPAPFTTGVTLSLNDLADDGPAKSGDNIGADFEVVTGSQGPDSIAGNAARNDLYGDDGDDSYSAGAGDDFITAFVLGDCGGDECNLPDPDQVACGEGLDTVDADKDDTIGADCEIVAVEGRILLTNKRDRFKLFRNELRVYARGGNDVITGFADDFIDGGRGSDTLRGGDRDDRLVGGRGRDRVLGGSGADRIRVRDGARDTVSCGSGRDGVIADRRDRVARDCESVKRR